MTEEIKIVYEMVDRHAESGGEDSFDFTAIEEEEELGSLLLPAIQKAPEDGVAESDGFDLAVEDGGGSAGLLLPAVQAAREAAPRQSCDETEMTVPDDFLF